MLINKIRHSIVLLQSDTRIGVEQFSQGGGIWPLFLWLFGLRLCTLLNTLTKELD